MLLPAFRFTFGVMVVFISALLFGSMGLPLHGFDPAISEALASNGTVNVVVALKPTAASVNAVRSIGAPGVSVFASKGHLNVSHRFESLGMLAAAVDASGLAALASDPSVAGIYYDYPVHALDASSNAQLNADDVQRFQFNGQNVTGSNQTICVIDTGIDYRNPAFGTCGGVGVGAGCRVVGGYDYVNDDADPLDDHKHGTHVAGIAGANGSGLIGVAPGAKFVALKVLDSAGSGSSSDVIAGIDWCTANRTTYNITVISMSLGAVIAFANACDASFGPDSTAINASVSAGLFVSVSSGNAYSKAGISTPACLANAVPVGAVNSTDGVADFSQDWAHYLILAPGVLTNSTVLNNNTQQLSGTSMAAPHVSGVVALLQSFAQPANGSLASIPYLRALLNRTGLAVTDTDPDSGRVHYRVDALAALQALQADVSPRSLALQSFPNNTVAGVSYAFVNVTFFDDNATASACILEWSNGSATNFTMASAAGSCSFNVTGQADVNASFRAYINDSYGNVGSASFAGSLDTRPPQNVSANVTNNSVSSSTSVSVNVSMSDLNAHSCILQLDGVNASNLATFGSCNFTLALGEGVHSFILYGNDTLGRYNQSGNFTFTTDLSVPTSLALLSPASNNSFTRLNYTFVNFSFSEATPHMCTLRYGNATALSDYNMTRSANACWFNVTGNFSNPAGQTHNFTFFINDTLGNTNSSGPYFVTFDVQAPSVTAVVPAASYVNRSTAFGLSANASDAGASVLNVSVHITNGSTPSVYSQSPVFSALANYSFFFADLSALADGNYTLNVTALDNASNAASNASVNITVDGTAPVAPALSAQANASGFVFLNWSSAADEVGIQRYVLSRNGTLLESSMVRNYTDASGLFGASYDYVVTAYDLAGNPNASTAVTALMNDSVMPRQSANVTAGNSANGAVELAWTNVTLDLVGGTERNVSFRVFRTDNTSSTNVSNMTLLATVNALAYSDASEMDAGATYLYVIASLDANGNANSSVLANNSFANHSVNHTTVATCSNAFSDFSACSGGSQSRTRVCLGRNEIQTQACSSSGSSGGGSSGSSGGGTAGGSSGGGSSSPSTGGARGGGGGGGGSGKELFVVQQIPKALELTPGATQTLEAEVSSFYTGFLRVRNVTIRGVPEDWYTVRDLDLVSPISKTNFSIDWHPPSDARGNYSVRLDIVGVGTKNAGLLNTSYAFELVLPPAESVQSDGSENKASRTQQESVPTNAILPLEPATTDFSVYLYVLAGLVTVGLLAGGLELWKWKNAHAGAPNGPPKAGGAKKAASAETGAGRKNLPTMVERSEKEVELQKKPR